MQQCEGVRLLPCAGDRLLESNPMLTREQASCCHIWSISGRRARRSSSHINNLPHVFVAMDRRSTCQSACAVLLRGAGSCSTNIQRSRSHRGREQERGNPHNQKALGAHPQFPSLSFANPLSYTLHLSLLLAHWRISQASRCCSRPPGLAAAR